MTALDNGVRTVKAKIRDKDNGEQEYTATVTINNVNPTLGAIVAPTVLENATATISGSFADVGSLDTHSAVIDWGDGTTSTATIDPVLRTFTASHTYADNPVAGPAYIYPVQITLVDDDGGSVTGTTSVTVTAVNDAPSFLVVQIKQYWRMLGLKRFHRQSVIRRSTG